MLKQREIFVTAPWLKTTLGFLFSTIGRFNEALNHTDRARALFSELGDRSSVAQVDDTKARALLAGGEPVYAERFARAAVRVLEKGDENSLLAATLVTHGIALARIGKEGSAVAVLERAVDVAQSAGDLESAGRARLTILEEFENSMAMQHLVAASRVAIEQLKGSQDPSIKRD